MKGTFGSTIGAVDVGGTDALGVVGVVDVEGVEGVDVDGASDLTVRDGRYDSNV